jgi:acyl carrier protein
MDNITTRFEQCLRRHLRLVKPDSVNYAVELVKLGLDSMTAVALLLEMEMTFDIRFPGELIVEDTFRTAGALKEAAIQWLRGRPGPFAARPAAKQDPRFLAAGGAGALGLLG